MGQATNCQEPKKRRECRFSYKKRITQYLAKPDNEHREAECNQHVHPFGPARVDHTAQNLRNSKMCNMKEACMIRMLVQFRALSLYSNSSFSGKILYLDWASQFHKVFYTAAPILVFAGARSVPTLCRLPFGRCWFDRALEHLLSLHCIAVLDRDLTPDTLHTNPQIYTIT